MILNLCTFLGHPVNIYFIYHIYHIISSFHHIIVSHTFFCPISCEFIYHIIISSFHTHFFIYHIIISYIISFHTRFFHTSYHHFAHTFHLYISSFHIHFLIILFHFFQHLLYGVHLTPLIYLTTSMHDYNLSMRKKDLNYKKNCSCMQELRCA